MKLPLTVFETFDNKINIGIVFYLFESLIIEFCLEKTILIF